MFRSLKERWMFASKGSKIVLGVVLIMSVLLFTALVIVLRNWQGTVVETASPSESKTSIVEEAIEIDGLQRLSPAGRSVLQEHFKALGGGQRIGGVLSLLASGSIDFTSGKNLTAVFIRKGAQMRLSLKTDNGQEVLVVADSDRWRCRWRVGNLVEREDLRSEDLERLRLASYSLNTLYDQVRVSGRIAYRGTQAFEYKMSHCFEMDGADGELLRYYIDADTFLDAGLEIRRFESDGTLRVLRQVYGERIDIGGIQVPNRVDGYVDGKQVQTFHIEDIDLNVGIFDTAFQRPTEDLHAESEIKAESFGGAPDPRPKPSGKLLPDGP